MTEAEQFSLRWNNFHSNLTEGFHSLLEEVDLVDVTLAADGQYLQAHKIVLSVCSPYFKQLFKANPCKHPIVILKDVCHKDLEALLQFMYQGEVNVRQEELAPFLKTAEMLQIKGLTGNDSRSGQSPESTNPPSPIPRSMRETHREPVREPPRESIREAIRETVRESVRESVPQDPVPVPLTPEVQPRPFKRQRTESPLISTLPTLPQLSTPPVPHVPPLNTSLPAPISPPEESMIEFVQLTKPKQEPIDYDPDAEGDNKDSSPSDLVQLLHGESSQPSQDVPQGPPQGLFNTIPPFPQDSGGSQDSLQGYRLSSSEDIFRYLKYRCDICQKCFTRRDHLTTHFKNLHGEAAGPFLCVACSQLYKNADSLRKHIGKYHKNLVPNTESTAFGSETNNRNKTIKLVTFPPT